MDNVAPPAPSRLAQRWLTLARWSLGLALIGLMLASALLLLSPRAFGVLVVQGRGTSMLPAYRDGDIVLVEITGAAEVHLGEVILFQQGGTSIFHRVIEKSTAPDGHVFLATRGDNNRIPDPPIDGSQVQGKLIAEVPLAGSLSRSLGTTNVLMSYRLVLVFGSLVGLALTIRRLSRTGRNQPA